MADVALSSKDTANPASGDYLVGIDVSASNGIRKFILSDDWRFGRLGVGVAPTNRFHMVATGAAEKDVYIHHTLGDGTGLASTYRPFDMQCAHNATDIDTTTLSWSGIRSGVTFGSGGIASTGKAHNFSADMVIAGCGDANTEYSNYYGAMRYDLGTGYDQTAVPTGRGWFTDWSIHGPVAARPDMLNGITMFYNNYYNGSPADSPAAAMWIVTRKGSGGALDATHTTANTYPIDVGLGIVGDSNSGASTIGWTKAIQIGGFGSGWKESGSSYIGTGIDLSEFATYGIYIHDRHASGTGPAIAVGAGAGAVVVGSNATADATALFQVLGPNSAMSPLVFLGSTANTQSYQIKLRNAAGQHNWAVAGGAGNYLTGSASGDAVLTTTTSGKALHLGGTTKVITVTSANTLGFFAATPIAQAVLATGSTTDQVITALQNLGLVRQS
jgi:hypothetical protein